MHALISGARFYLKSIVQLLHHRGRRQKLSWSTFKCNGFWTVNSARELNRFAVFHMSVNKWQNGQLCKRIRLLYHSLHRIDLFVITHYAEWNLDGKQPVPIFSGGASQCLSLYKVLIKWAVFVTIFIQSHSIQIVNSVTDTRTPLSYKSVHITPVVILAIVSPRSHCAYLIKHLHGAC